MIVSMKKIHLIVQKKDVESALERLADLGTVHVEHSQAPTGKTVAKARETVEILDQVIRVLESKKNRQEQQPCDDWKEKATEVLDLQALNNQHQEFIDKRAMRIAKCEEWGNFEPQDIRDLAEKGIFVHLYEVPTSVKNIEVPGGVIFQEVGATKNLRRFVAVLQENKNLPYDRVYPPPVSLEKMKLLQTEEQTEATHLEKLIWEHTKYVEQFRKIRQEAQYQLDLKEAQSGMYDYDEICFLKGFIPEDQVLNLKLFAKENDWGILIEAPTADDEVPTQLRNPQWVNLSKPAFQLIEILPGYKEVDISPVFLIFFTLFFGLLIGDAAYGLIFLAATVFCHIKFGSRLQDKTVFWLMYLLTGFTVLIGVLTGTYFGQAWLPASVKPIVPWLNDPKNLQYLCFTIALIHLTIARLWAFVRLTPSILAAAQIGWLLVVWGMYFVANMFVLGRPFPPFALWMIIGGAGMALFFMAPPRELLKKIGSEAIPFLLSIINAGTDIVSYIRLFAVGVATIAVADAANSMWNTPLFGFNYVLFFGLHILNMILALMAILVHAVRLNVLEFSGHMGLEWAGVKYRPLNKTIKVA